MPMYFDVGMCALLDPVFDRKKLKNAPAFLRIVCLLMPVTHAEFITTHRYKRLHVSKALSAFCNAVV